MLRADRPTAICWNAWQIGTNWWRSMQSAARNSKQNVKKLNLKKKKKKTSRSVNTAVTQQISELRASSLGKTDQIYPHPTLTCSPRLINSKLKRLFVKKLFYLTHNPASRRVISSPEEFDHPLAPTKSYSNTGLPERPRVFIVNVAVCDWFQGRNRDAEIVGKQATYKKEQDTGRI